LKERILVTGCAGFIGMHITKKLLEGGYSVYGVDSLDEYYDPKLKKNRLKNLLYFKSFSFSKIDISNYSSLDKVFKRFKPSKVINLAAQAGVRYSLINPHSYIKANINGFMNVLECSRKYKINGVIYASSSSIYGNNKTSELSVNSKTDSPISIYAVTKKSNELMAYAYSHLYGLHTTGLRFFTVYGAWGRPDMGMYIFTKNIIQNQKIRIFNYGNMKRDFTYIDDIIDGIIVSIEKNYPCEVFNLGNSKQVPLMDVIKIIEQELNIKAHIKYEALQSGDTIETLSDISYSINKLGYNPKISINEGLPKFIKWLREYEGI
jgi:UDP-glucuronate 4-epimerase